MSSRYSELEVQKMVDLLISVQCKSKNKNKNKKSGEAGSKADVDETFCEVDKLLFWKIGRHDLTLFFKE